MASIGVAILQWRIPTRGEIPAVTVLDDLRVVEERIATRLAELEPLIQEYNELQEIAARLNIDLGRGTAAASKPSPKPAKAKPKAKPKGAAKSVAAKPKAAAPPTAAAAAADAAKPKAAAKQQAAPQRRTAKGAAVR